ncbi:MAG: hypothetical protein ACOCSE_04640 [Chitinivibrionales bacterium]
MILLFLIDYAGIISTNCSTGNVEGNTFLGALIGGGSYRSTASSGFWDTDKHAWSFLSDKPDFK